MGGGGIGGRVGEVASVVIMMVLELMPWIAVQTTCEVGTQRLSG